MRFASRALSLALASYGGGYRISLEFLTKWVAIYSSLDIVACADRALLSQIAWVSIGLASWRFRKAWVAQGRPLSEMKFRARWTWPWGPLFVVSLTLSQLFSGNLSRVKLGDISLCDHSLYVFLY